MCIAVNVSLLNYFSTLEKIYNPFDQILERFREREREKYKKEGIRDNSEYIPLNKGPRGMWLSSVLNTPFKSAEIL